MADQDQQNQPAPQPTKQRNWFRDIALPYGIGTNAYDLKTTYDALNSGNAHEANPIMGSSFGRIAATKAAITGAQMFALDKLSKNHPKLAMGSGLAAGTVPLVAGIHNSRIGK